MLNATTVSYPGSVRIYLRIRRSRVTAIANRRVTLMRRIILSSVQQDAGRFLCGNFGSASHWRQVQDPAASKRKTRQSILTRWDSPTPLALCTVLTESVQVVLRSGLGGAVIAITCRPMWTACVPRPGPPNRVIRYLFI